MDMNWLFWQASRGLFDYAVLGATQVDQYGNINSTMLGEDYSRPKVRFSGSGGANEMGSFCWRTIVIMMHEKRRLVEKVDFITTPGFLDGSEGARERAGLPRGTGPYRVITSKALFGYDEATRKMKLLAIMPHVSIEEVLENMMFQPVLADKVEKLAPPTEAELKLLREELDPKGAVIKAGPVVKLEVSRQARATK
jgi:glutaconate CoA-transferase subunit B